MKIRSRSFKNWLKAKFSRIELKDMAQHGANGGWHGLIYYHETSKLYQRFKEELWCLLSTQALEYGYPHPFAFLAEFQDNQICSAHEWECLIVWFAAETYAAQLAAR